MDNKNNYKIIKYKIYNSINKNLKIITMEQNNSLLVLLEGLEVKFYK